MSLDHSLIHLLVCPVCKGALQMGRDEDLHPSELICPADRLGFPIRDGIPVMLESEARTLTETEAEAVRVARKRSPAPGAGG
jgi:uncharacterized protein